MEELRLEVGQALALVSLTLKCVQVPCEDLVQCLARSTGLKSLDLDQTWPETVYTMGSQLSTKVLCAIGRCPRLTTLRLARLDCLWYNGSERLSRKAFRSLQRLSLHEIQSVPVSFLTGLFSGCKKSLTHLTLQRVKIGAEHASASRLSWQLALSALLACSSLICFTLQELSHDGRELYPDERRWFAQTRATPYWTVDPVRHAYMWRMLIDPHYIEDLCLIGRLVRCVRDRRWELGIAEGVQGDENFWDLKFRDTLGMVPPVEVVLAIYAELAAAQRRRVFCLPWSPWTWQRAYMRRRRGGLLAEW